MRVDADVYRAGRPLSVPGPFGRPGKRKVEGLVKFARSNFMTPVSMAASDEDLNALLAERCRLRQSDQVGMPRRSARSWQRIWRRYGPCLPWR